MKPLFVAFDTETTGLYPESCELCEIGGVKFTIDEHGNPVEESTFESLMAIDGLMPKAASRINHITDDMLKDAPSPAEAVAKFFRWAGQSSILLAHNAQFDVSFVGRAIHKAGLMLPKHPVFCTKLMSRKIWPEAGHSLRSLEATLLSEHEEWGKYKDSTEGSRHRALWDSKLLMFVFSRIFGRFPAHKRGLPDVIEHMCSIGGKDIKFDRTLDSHELQQLYAEMKFNK